MKKYLNLALGYGIAAMAAGVFYREFTKIKGFEGVTMLGKVHGHLFMLGMLLFLIVALFAKQQQVERERSFRAFMWLHSLGLPLTAIMMILRGVIQVLEIVPGRALNASLSGMAGVGHILVAAGIICLLLALKRSS